MRGRRDLHGSGVAQPQGPVTLAGQQLSGLPPLIVASATGGRLSQTRSGGPRPQQQAGNRDPVTKPPYLSCLGLVVPSHACLQLAAPKRPVAEPPAAGHRGQRVHASSSAGHSPDSAA